MAPMEAGSGAVVGVAVGLTMTLFGVEGLTVGETVTCTVGWTVAWAETFFFCVWCWVEDGVVDAAETLTAGVVDTLCALTMETPAKINSTTPKLIVLLIEASSLKIISD